MIKLGKFSGLKKAVDFTVKFCKFSQRNPVKFTDFASLTGLLYQWDRILAI